jgi:hypothetical protein
MRFIQRLAVAVLLSTLLTACAMVSTTQLPVADRKVEVYVTGAPTKPYTEVAYVECMGSAYHSNTRLLKKLTAKADKAGYDALIQVEFKYIFLTPYITAVAVKYR